MVFKSMSCPSHGLYGVVKCCKPFSLKKKKKKNKKRRNMKLILMILAVATAIATAKEIQILTPTKTTNPDSLEAGVLGH